MAKINNMYYGTENDELLTEASIALSYTETDWENVSPTQFDEMDINALKLDGHCYKNFYLCHSNAIPNLFESVMFKQSGYVTYFSNISTEGLIPEKISALLKTSHRKSYLIQEVLSSQLLNFFNCKTPFNFAIKTSNKNDNYLASIDFISDNEKLVLFSELDIIWTEDVNAMIKQLECLNQDSSSILHKISPNSLKQLKEDLVLTFLTRYCLLQDYDFDLYNCGLLVNTKEKYAKLINFDFELCLQPLKVSEHMIKLILSIIDYAKSNNFNIYANFINKVSSLHKILNEINFETENIKYNTTISTLKENLNTLIKCDNYTSCLEINI